MPYRSVNPATPEVLKTLTEHSDEEVMDAFAKADKSVRFLGSTLDRRAREDHRPRRSAPSRTESELARLATVEMGKRIAESRGEVELSAANLGLEEFVNKKLIVVPNIQS